MLFFAIIIPFVSQMHVFITQKIGWSELQDGVIRKFEDG
jgi:hypothetical protein